MIASDARIGDQTKIGDFCVIESNVSIGVGCTIGHHVILKEGSNIGDFVQIDDHSIIGKLPMRASTSATTKNQALPPTLIGNRCLIGSHVILYKGCTIGDKTMVADFASVRENVSIGKKTIVGRGVAIENNTSIGSNCKIETNAYITAFSEIGNDVFIAPGVLTSNDKYLGRTEERLKHFKGITVEEGGRIGVGAVILPNKIIHEESVVGAGSVVTKDVPEAKIVVGVPAKHLRNVPENQKLAKK